VRESKNIRHKSELAHLFEQLVRDEKDLPWQPNPVASEGFSSGVVLKFDDRHLQFRPRFALVPDANEAIRLTAEEKERTLFVVPRLNPAFLDVCRKHRVSVVDLNGRTFIRAPGVWLERGPLPGRDYRFELEPRNAFVGKSVRIVRTLLTDPQRLWEQSEITQRTGASSGLVSRITTHLLRQGLLRKVDARRFHVVSPSLLLDEWAKSDEFGRRAATQRYSALISDPVQLAKKLRNDLTHAPDAPLFAFTQWIAAWLRHPYTEPPIVSAYISRLPGPEQLERLGLRPVNDAGRVWLHVPTDEGVFLERRTVENLPLVTDAQIYIDLVKTGLRGPEQAQALREWDGFCRP
jgi:hypothetical protein